MKLNRKEIVEQLKEFNLLEEVKRVFGDNYTRITNENLQYILDKHIERIDGPKITKTLDQVKVDEINDIGLRKAFVRLLVTLQMSETLFPDEISSILEEL